MGGAVILTRLSTIEEALVVQSLLTAHGVIATLENSYHAQNDWFILQALNGVGILVPHKDVSLSKEILAEFSRPFTEEASDKNGTLILKNKRRLLRRWSLPLFFFGILGPFVFLLAFAINYLVVEIILNASDVSRPIWDWENLPFPAYHTSRGSMVPNPDGLLFYFILIGLFVTSENLRRASKQKDGAS